MASLGHIAVGMAAARIHHERRTPRWPAMAIWAALSMLPDADVVGFALGVQYGDPWGHRGATHSLPLSLAVGAAIALAAPLFRLPRLRTGVIAAAVLASHALLDTFTDGGLGCALLWPFDLTRYFAPWNPIPVSPIGLAYLSPYGLMVAGVELVLFSPCLVFALWRRGTVPRPAAAGLLACWLAAAWLIVSHDPLRESIVGAVLRDETQYASGFSDRALRGVRRGQSERAVREALGSPLHERWFFAFDETQPCRVVDFNETVVVSADDAEACLELGISAGASRIAVEDALGPPEGGCWQYTRSTNGGYFRDRVVCFEAGKVADVFRQWSSRRVGE